MSLNTAHANGGVLIHSGECILLFSDNVMMEFHGQDQPEFIGSKRGRLFLTTHRMIFNAKDQKERMQSFSFPFITLSDVELEQPMFGANYIKGKCRAQPNGNWTGECKFKLHFKNGGAIEFGQAMLRAASMANRNGPGFDAPPPYQPPTSDWYAAPPPAYQAAPGGYYGWQPPTNVFPEQPPANGVYMTDSPPPYPGINGPYQGYASGGAAQQQPQPSAWGNSAQPSNWGQPQSNGAPGWANPGYNPQSMSQGGAYPSYGQPSYNNYQPIPPQFSQYSQNPPQYHPNPAQYLQNPPQYSQNPPQYSQYPQNPQNQQGGYYGTAGIYQKPKPY
ncbi:WW domain-binding protein 2 isoform X1 [Neodiprion lecontei]|uniref:WW domain-binding protein 2 isoform X1 n=1 Tax=Neodiprion lecontei TaxID=441921 RepID=A0A6J0BQJ8_NEOLC|nr:WW domain-binding protein 2 isoform X1 [Neodiprion lecontei]XP_046414405.1 WW domain-binding protein 2 isoform X1 [Neodiprion fabricii]XP_046470198.1 WW domain-binding protein 2 isoform X1 [Neodiprion pinetum]